MKRDDLVTLDDAARHFKKTRRTLENWLGQGMPHRRQGRRVLLHLPDVQEWREEQVRAEERAKTAPTEASERARKLRAEANLRELDEAERRNRLIERAVHLERVEAIVAGLSAVSSGRLQ